MNHFAHPEHPRKDIQYGIVMPPGHHLENAMLPHRIKQFIAVADAGSIRGAARQLGVSQPALTRALQQLEEELGAQLVRRGVRGASLTNAGAAFLARARVAEAELRMGADEAKRSNDGGGLVTIGVSPSAASVLLPELVTTLQKRRPNTRIRLIESNPSALPSLVREAALDMAVAHARSGLDPGLHFRYLYDIQLRVVVRPGHPLARTRSLAELEHASWLSMAAPDSSNDNIKQSFLAAGLPTPVLAVHCGSHSVALDLIAATDMIALLPPALLRSHMTAGRLIELRLAEPMVPLQVGLYTRAGSPASPAAKMAAQIIAAIARRLISSGELRNTEATLGPRPSHDRPIAKARC
jgi:LysR family transcriptional regulator, regulator of abg operon